MLIHPVLNRFVESLFNQSVLLPVISVAMVVFIKWLWWTLGGSGIRQSSIR